MPISLAPLPSFAVGYKMTRMLFIALFFATQLLPAEAKSKADSTSASKAGLKMLDKSIDRFLQAPPGNDDCSGAFTLANDGTLASGDNTNAVQSSSAPSCGESDCTSRDVWFEYTAPACSGIFELTVTDQGFDVVVAMFDACGGSELACGNFNYEPNDGETLYFEAIEGTKYFIQVSGYEENDAGAFQIQVNCVATPPNDDCTAALELPNDGTVATSDTTKATNGAPKPSCAGSTGGTLAIKDVWFEYTAPACSGFIDFKLNPSQYDDAVLAIFDSCGGAELACANDESVLPSEERLFVEVTEGDKYFIQVSITDPFRIGPVELTATCKMPEDEEKDKEKKKKGKKPKGGNEKKPKMNGGGAKKPKKNMR